MPFPERRAQHMAKRALVSETFCPGQDVDFKGEFGAMGNPGMEAALLLLPGPSVSDST